MSIFGINTNPAGGIMRATAYMRNAEREINHSLASVERGNIRYADSPVEYAKASVAQKGKAEAKAQRISNMPDLPELDAAFDLTTGLLDLVNELRTAAVKRDEIEAVGGSALDQRAKLDALSGVIASLAASVDVKGTAIFGGTESFDPVGQGTTYDLGVAALVALDSTSTVADIEAEMYKVMEANAQLDHSQDLIELANKTHGQFEDSQNILIRDLTAVNEGEEQVKITGLQLRQQSILASMQIQNQAAANSAINLLG